MSPYEFRIGPHKSAFILPDSGRMTENEENQKKESKYSLKPYFDSFFIFYISVQRRNYVSMQLSNYTSVQRCSYICVQCSDGKGC